MIPSEFLEKTHNAKKTPIITNMMNWIQEGFIKKEDLM